MIYHVTERWDGGDLRSLARRVDDGDIDLDAALDLIMNRWTNGDYRSADEYLDGDGHQVHCHSTLTEAIDYRDEYCEGGEILVIDESGLAVEAGQEYPHPVVRDTIPAEAITEVIR